MLSDKAILQWIKNPTNEAYEIKMCCNELTFFGVSGQPDFARLLITVYPNEKVIELRSLKRYLQQFRDKVLSYERLINVIYDDLKEIFSPVRLRIVMECYPRGGISSRLVIDSDWKIRGGSELFKDWKDEDYIFEYKV